MNCWLAAAHIVIVHRGQIIVNERIAMHAFKGCGHTHGFALAGFYAKQGCTFHNKKRPQALAAIKRAMAHGGHQLFWADDFARQRAVAQNIVQQCFNGLRLIVEQVFKVNSGVVFHMRSGSRRANIAQAAKHLYAGEGQVGSRVMSEPIIKQNGEGLTHRERSMALRHKSAGKRGNWLRLVMKSVLFVVLFPVVLTLLYLPPFVHPVSTLMVKDLISFSGYERRWVPLDQIAPVLAHSVIMSEDGQFCAHHGVDLGELRLVINDALAGKSTRGASTITMQTVKNLYLWQKPLTSLRKAVELPLAIYVDLVMPKRRIMEIYLNIAEWSPGIYGIEAAAQHYFGVPASKLTRRQAALLAVTLPNPQARNPAKPGTGLRRLANLIERRSARSGAYVGCLKSTQS